MKKKDNSKKIFTSKRNDYRSEIYRKCLVEAILKYRFKILRDRLMAVNHWSDFTDNESGCFKLCGSSNAEIYRSPQAGDYIHLFYRSNVIRTDHQFWFQIKDIVKCESVDHDSSTFQILIVPRLPPGEISSDALHAFYSSNFVIELKISDGIDFIFIGLYGHTTKYSHISLRGRIKNFFLSENRYKDIIMIEFSKVIEGLISF